MHIKLDVIKLKWFMSTCNSNDSTDRKKMEFFLKEYNFNSDDWGWSLLWKHSDSKSGFGPDFLIDLLDCFS